MTEEKEKQTENKQNETNPYELSLEQFANLRAQGIDPEKPTLDQMYPPILENDGNDLSLMTAKEQEVWQKFWRVRKYLWNKYPLPKKLSNSSGEPQGQKADEDLEVDISRAARDLKAPDYVEALGLLYKIIGKIHVPQQMATPFEKICVRYYSFLADNLSDPSRSELFRAELSESDIFEAVDAYFKICRKYHVPTFEEPYYFLSEQQRLNLKLEADELKRTGGYSEFEIHISNLEAFL